MVETPSELRIAANYFDLEFFGHSSGSGNNLDGYGFPFIAYFPDEHDWKPIEKEGLGPAFNLMVRGLCAICCLNPESTNYTKVIVEGEPVTCKTLKPCCGATEETFYFSGSADINVPYDTISTRPKRLAFSTIIEANAACLNTDVRSKPYIPLGQR